MVRRFFFGVAVCCLALFATATPAQAQGSITGTATGPGAVAGAIQLFVWNTGTGFAQSGAIDGAGNYTIAGLPAGSYFVVTQNSIGLINQYYRSGGNQSCGGCSPASPGTLALPGTQVTVTSGIAATHPNFTLVAGPRISGHITDAVSSLPIAGVRVTIALQTGSGVNSIEPFATTNGSGDYTSGPGFPPGTYVALTSNTLGYVERISNDTPCPGGSCGFASGNGIVVTSSNVTGVNFHMAAGGTFTGTVTNTSLAPVVATSIQVVTASGKSVGNAVTNGIGVYTTPPLPPGTYYANASGNATLQAQTFNGFNCISCSPVAGTPITVGSGSTTGINFVLSAAGSISGVVKNASLVGVNGMSVSLIGSNGSQLLTQTTSGAGNYSFTGLPPGTYFIRVNGNNTSQPGRVYTSLDCFSCDPLLGTPINLASGEIRAGVDVTLAAAGSIAGTVTIAGTSTGLVGLTVTLLAPNGNSVTTATTTAGGAYIFNGLTAGSYYVRVQGNATNNYVSEVWAGSPTTDVYCVGCTVSALGTPIVLAAGQNKTSIDFGLHPGGSFSGTVTNGPGGPGLGGVSVQASDSNGGSAGSATTAGDGTYKVVGLLPGSYFARTSAGNGFVDRLYNDIKCFSCSSTGGDPVAVAGTADTPGINFALSAGGRIAGRVTDSSGLPIAFASVNVYNANNASVAFASSGNDGTYVTGSGLPTGTYFVATTSLNGYVNALYSGGACVNCAAIANTGTPVGVTEGSTTPGINLVLTHGGQITGLVQTTGGSPTPLANVQVQAFVVAGTSRVNVGTATTNLSGRYTITGLPSGTYYVRTNNAVGLVDRLYATAVCLSCDVANGTPVVVASPSATPNINFQLDAAGSIAGTVKDAISGEGIGNVQVNVYPDTGGTTALFTIRTTPAGTYFVRDLPAGTYRLVTSATNSVAGAGYVNQAYAPSSAPNCMTCDPLLATGITIAGSSALTGKDFLLTKGRTISGQVTNAAGAVPVAGVTMSVFTSTGGSLSTAVQSPIITDLNGNYTVPGLLPGSYLLRTTNTLGFIDKLYSGIECLGCSVTGGTPIDVTFTNQTANFSLTQGARISGTVTDAGGNPLSLVTVNIFRSNGTSAGSTTTGANGKFITSGLPSTPSPATYYLRTFNSQGYVDRLYNGINCSSCTVTTGTAIPVTGTATTTGKDFILPLGGSITGTVTQTNTSPIPSASVQVYNSDGLFVTSSSTNASGVYTVKGLAPGGYFARTSNSNLPFIDRLYTTGGGVNCVGCVVTTGSQIAVVAGVATSGINFVLETGGRFGGTVTAAAGGAGIAGVSVQVYSSTGTFINSATTTASGSYLSGGLVPGADYFIRTSSTLGYINQLYSGIPCQTCSVTTGTRVTATSGTTTINFSLAAGGSITGIVTDTAGPPVPVGANEVGVNVYTPQGTLAGSASTVSGGTYTVSGLSTGDYVLRTSNSAGFVDELFDNKVCVGCSLSGGTLVHVAAGSTTTGKDFHLDRGGRISGTVRDGLGAGIAGITVSIYNSVNYFVTSVVTDNLGNYITKTGLQGGASQHYFARTSNNFGYTNVTWPSNTCLNCSVTVGTPIAVTAGATTTGIDFTLALGGRFTGVVTDAATGLPLSGINVSVFLASGVPVGGSNTNAAGVFTSPGLPTGDYYARTNNGLGYVNRLYDAHDCVRCSVATGQAIHVDGGAVTTGVNFALSAGGRITGTITDAANGNAPIAGASVTVYDSGGNAVTGAVTNASGVYTTTAGLTTGPYYARTFNQAGYVNKLFDAVTCFQCNVTTGQPIGVTTGATTTGVNFGLVPGGRIAGTVTTGGQPVSDVSINIFSSGGTYLTFARTGTNGQYVTGEGLPPGIYYVVTENQSGLIDQLYNNKSCSVFQILGGISGSCAITSGNGVTVAGTATTGSIDFSLLPGLQLSGKITDKISGDPVSGGQVNIYNPGGAWVAYAFADGLGNWTSASGLAGSPAGTRYYVKAGLASPANPYVSKLYDDITCAGCDPLTGTPITLTTLPVGSINFALERGSIVSGTVLDSGAQPIFGALVRLFNGAGLLVATGRTDDSGAYSLTPAVPAGTYYARTLNGLGFVDKLYDTGDCLACDVTRGTAITVDGLNTVSGINFVLTAGGRIGGTVTASGTGIAVAGSKIRFYNSAGSFIGETFTNGVGAYVSPGLPPGNYYIRTANYAGLIDELYDNVPCTPCTLSQGSRVTVVTGGLAGVNFALDGGGLISGYVTDQGTGSPLAGVTVAVYRASDHVLVATTDPTDSNGFYSISLPVGIYEVAPNPFAGYRPADLSGLRGAFARATVTVETGTETTGVGFALIACAPLTLNPATLPLAAQGQLYSTTLTATGGVAPFTFSITDGNPNTGLALAASGLLAGTPAFSGTGNFTVAATDANFCAGTRTFALTACSFFLSATSYSTTAGAGSRTVNLTASAADCPWLVTTAATWITITSPASGTGDSTVAFTFAANTTGASRSGVIRMGGQVFTLTQAPSTSLPAFGQVDTPAPGVTGVAGSLAVTGWALDDVEVKRVLISRDAVAGEAPGEKYLGDATFVDGARPDVASANPNLPFNTRAGWGYLLLTNMLPNQGNGTFTLHMDALDAEGSLTRLGNRTFTGDNANSVQPFGAIDTPGQGAVISGSTYVNFGWALTPNPKSIPANGSTITVFVDSLPAGNVTYNNFREDVAGLFPGLANTAGAIGYRYFDTTSWTNGVHTISWVVFDSGGQGEGIGSRYFTVNNVLASQRFAPGVAGMLGPAASGPAVSSRLGFDRAQPMLELLPDAAGGRSISVGQLGRVELRFGQTCGRVSAAQIVNGERTALPVGSALDPAGSFAWMPGPAFLGAYTFEFTVPSCGGGDTNIQVTMTVVSGR